MSLGFKWPNNWNNQPNYLRRNDWQLKNYKNSIISWDFDRIISGCLRAAYRTIISKNLISYFLERVWVARARHSVVMRAADFQSIS